MARALRSVQTTQQKTATPVERMYFAWNDALSRNDAEQLLALYTRDAHFEGPLVPHLLDTKSGVLHGHDQLRPLFDKLAGRKPKVRQYYRSGYLTNGKRMIFEYPRDAGDGEQMDFVVEVMELNDEGLIERHCVYWAGSASACCSGANIIAENDSSTPMRRGL